VAEVAGYDLQKVVAQFVALANPQNAEAALGAPAARHKADPPFGLASLPFLFCSSHCVSSEVGNATGRVVAAAPAQLRFVPVASLCRQPVRRWPAHNRFP
jgi:hypothetical protein